MINSYNEADDLVKQRKFSSHCEVIREYTRILNEFEETERCTDAIDILLNNIQGAIKTIWEIIITGVFFKFMKEYDRAFEAFSRLNGIIYKHNLLMCFVLKEELYAYAYMDEEKIPECIAGYDTLIEYFKNEKDTDIQLQIAQITLYRENLTAKLEKYEECIKLDNIIIEKYGGINQEEFINIVLKAMHNKAKYLEHTNGKRKFKRA